MKKYNKIMGVFTGTIAKLEALASKNSDLIAKKTTKIKALKTVAQELDLELHAAMNTVDKMKEFLEG